MKKQILTNPAPPKFGKQKELILSAIIVSKYKMNIPIKDAQAIDTTWIEVADNNMTTKDSKQTLDEYVVLLSMLAYLLWPLMRNYAICCHLNSWQKVNT